MLTNFHNSFTVGLTSRLNV